MELTPLRYFRSIAQHGHMTRAARALGVSQPALSAMLKKLEGEVGAELLHRTGRGVELTEAGRVFLQHAEDALRRADAGVQAVRELVGLERGSIRVGGGATATTYLLPPVVGAVRRKHPGLRFYVREQGSNAVAAAVLSGELDLGIVTLPMSEGAAEELLTIPLVEDELRLIVPPGFGYRHAPRGVSSKLVSSKPDATRRVEVPRRSDATRSVAVPGRTDATRRVEVPRRTDATRSVEVPGRTDATRSVAVPKGGKGDTGFRWKDLAGVPVVAFEAGTAVREIVDQHALKHGVALKVVMELRSIESIKQMVAAGIGVGFVSRFALKDGEGLACRDGGIGRKLAIVRRRDRVPSTAVQEFERVLRSAIARPGKL